jgi:hypothetical protein
MPNDDNILPFTKLYRRREAPVLYINVQAMDVQDFEKRTGFISKAISKAMLAGPVKARHVYSEMKIEPERAPEAERESRLPDLMREVEVMTLAAMLIWLVWLWATSH